MTITTAPLQKAIFETLNNDSAITSLIGYDNIFDHEIENANYPYISIDKWRTLDWSTDNDDGDEHVFDILIFAETSARKQLQDIVQKVVLALHETPLSLDVGELINLRFENVFFDEEGRTKLQLARLNFRAKIEY